VVAKLCAAICPFTAIEMKNKDEKISAEVIDAMCQGCGFCVAACPTKAIAMKHYTDKQVLAQLDVCCSEEEKGGI